jgi:hypothetical protein
MTQTIIALVAPDTVRTRAVQELRARWIEQIERVVGHLPTLTQMGSADLRELARHFRISDKEVNGRR